MHRNANKPRTNDVKTSIVNGPSQVASTAVDAGWKSKLLVTLPRVALGLIFLAGAIDGFTFIVTGAHLVNPDTSPSGLLFQHALEAAGFFWPLMKSVELIGALSLLSNRAPALGLALLAPIMAVITLFDVFLNPKGIPLAVVLVVFGCLLLRAYAPRFARLLD